MGVHKANNPVPGKTFDERGSGLTGDADVTQRKTGFRPDAQMQTSDNSIDPNSLIRRTSDPRLT